MRGRGCGMQCHSLGGARSTSMKGGQPSLEDWSPNRVSRYLCRWLTRGNLLGLRIDPEEGKGRGRLDSG